MEVKKKYIIFGPLIILFLWVISGYLIHSNYNGSERGTFGDMFGAINALFSGFALFGIIISILIQQNELNLQRKELADTRLEFKTNRITNILFKQVEFVNKSLDKLKFFDINRSYVLEINGYSNVLEENHSKNTLYTNLLSTNSKSLISLSSDVFNIMKNFEYLVITADLNEEEMLSLKKIFRSNIYQSMFDVLTHFTNWIDDKYQMFEKIKDKEIKAIELQFYTNQREKINYILNFGLNE